MDYLTQFLHNKIIIVAILSWAIAQVIKIVTDIIETKKFDLELVFSTGGMPSSHSSFVVSAALSVGFAEGFGSTVFAVSLVLAIVVMYDAAGVRRQAGKQAAALNKIIESIGFKIDERFKELLGHTPVEVAAGALLGTVVAVVANCLF
jgi:acid phosphatase family membrane protein YuiD